MLFVYTDYFLLGLIVERATGKSLRDFSDEQLFSPLGMKDSFFDDDQSFRLKGRALGYGHNRAGRFHRVMMNSSTIGPWGANTTVEDMRLWNHAFVTPRLASGEFSKAFFKEGTLLDNENCLSSYPHQAYKGLKRIWHTGGGPGFLAHFVRFPEHKFTVVLFSNFEDDRGFHWHEMVRLVGQIADLYLADEVETSAASDDSWNDEAPVMQLPEGDIADKVRTYQLPNGRFARLEKDNRALHLFRINRVFFADEARHFDATWPDPVSDDQRLPAVRPSI